MTDEYYLFYGERLYIYIHDTTRMYRINDQKLASELAQ